MISKIMNLQPVLFSSLIGLISKKGIASMAYCEQAIIDSIIQSR